MKIPQIHVLIGLLASISTLALEPNPTTAPKAFSRDSVAQAVANGYNELLDSFLRMLAEPQPGGLKIAADDIVDARSKEYQIEWFRRHGTRVTLPPPVLGSPPLQRLEEIPGRIVLARLERAGLRAWDQGPEGRVFQLAGSDIAERTNPAKAPWFIPKISTNFPPVGDFVSANGYALHLIRNGDFEEAARHFAAAADVPGGTSDGLWEIINFTHASLAYLRSGRIENARAMIEGVRLVPQRAELPQRTRFLIHLFRLPDPPSLLPSWSACLPNPNP